MISESFKQTAKKIVFDDFKKRLKESQKKYKNLQKQIDNLYKQLKQEPINEQCINEISSHLTIYLSQIDIIDNNIKEISEIIEHITTEISN